MKEVVEAHDLNYKMSKKIAQLTKVIYQLNSRNEDNDTTVQNIADRYEEEIADIMCDAKKKISILREQLCASSENKKLEIVVKELTRQHQKEKDDAMLMIADFKAQMLKNEAAAKHNFEERLLDATRELALSKEEFQSALEAIEINRNASLSSSKDMQNKHSDEMEALVKEYNERYNSMMIQQMEEHGQLEKRLNGEWSTKVTNLETDLKYHVQLHREQLLKEEERSASLLADLEGLRMEHKVIVVENDNMKVEILRLNERIEHLSSGSSELSAALCHSKQIEESYKDKEAQLRGELEKALRERDALLVLHQDQIAEFKSEITNLNNKIDILEAGVARMSLERDALSEEKSSMGETSSAQISALQVRIKELEGLFAAEVSKRKDEISQHVKTTNKLSSLEAEYLTLDEKLRLSLKKYDEDMSHARENHEEALRKVVESASGSTNDMISKHAEELMILRRDLERDCDTKLASKDRKHTDDTNNLKENHANKIAAMEEGFEMKFKSLEEQHKIKINAVNSENEALMKKLTGDASTVQGKLAESQKELLRVNKVLEVEKTIFSQKLLGMQEDHKAEIERRVEETKEMFHSLLESHSKESATKIAALEVLLENQQEKARLDREQLDRKYCAEIAALKRKYDEDIAAVLSSQACQVQNEKVKHETELIRLRKELTEKYEELQRTNDTTHSRIVDDLKKQLDTYQAAISEIENRHRCEIESFKNNSDQQHVNMSSRVTFLEGSLSKMKEDHMEALKKVREDHSNNMNEAIESLKNTHASMLRELEMKLRAVESEAERKTLQISADARAAQKDIEISYKNRIASLEKRKDDEREREIGEILSKSEKELEGVLKRHDCEVHALQEENMKLSLELSELKSTISTTSNKLIDCMERLDEEERKVEQLNELTRQLTDDHQKALAEQRRIIEFEGNETLEASNRSNQQVLNKLIDDFTAERVVFQDNIKNLKKRIADLEYKYANRESRAEDVEKINELLRRLRENEQALLKANHDMKFFKLELHNREESYNKVFGRQPTVAGSNGHSLDHPKGRSSTAEATVQKREFSRTAAR